MAALSLWTLLYLILNNVQGEKIVPAEPRLVCHNIDVHNLRCACNPSIPLNNRLIITPAAFLEERLRELTNLTVIRQLHILDCTVPDLEGPAIVHLDFRLNVDEYFKEFANLKSFNFKNISNIELQLSGTVQHGQLTVTLEDIFPSKHSPGSKHQGNAIISGGIEYCKNPCSQMNDAEPLEEGCTDCNIDSQLQIEFIHVENVHLVNLSLANHHHKVLDPANHVKQFGSARLLLTNVTNLSLENGDLTNVQYLISDDPRLPMQCWRVGGGAGADYFDRPGGWVEGVAKDVLAVDCDEFFPSDFHWPFWYYVVGAVGLLLVACCGRACIKGCVNNWGRNKELAPENQSSVSKEAEPMQPVRPASTSSNPTSKAAAAIEVVQDSSASSGVNANNKANSCKGSSEPSYNKIAAYKY